MIASLFCSVAFIVLAALNWCLEVKNMLAQFLFQVSVKLLSQSTHCSSVLFIFISRVPSLQLLAAT